MDVLTALGVTFDPSIEERPKAKPSVPAKTAGDPEFGPILEGGRNNALTSFAGRMRMFGFTEPIILVRLRQINNEEVKPPLDDEELQAIAKSVCRYEPTASLFPSATGTAAAGTALVTPGLPAASVVVPTSPSSPGPQAQTGQPGSPAAPAAVPVSASPAPGQGTPQPSALPHDPYHDTANAFRLVRNFGDIIRYVPEYAGWLTWNTKRWSRDSAAAIVEFAKTTGQWIYQEAAMTPSKDVSSALAKHARRSLDAPRVKAMITLAQSDPAVIAQASVLDRHDELLGVANGVIDLRTGTLRDARPEDLITRHAPVTFDRKATCPNWYRFLNRVTNNNRNSPLPRRERRALMKYLQRVVGYALSGLTVEQVLFFLYGTGANGKTTFLKVIEMLLGPELSCQLPYDSLVATKQRRSATNDLARLVGMRAVFTSEVEEGTFLAESLIKQLTGSDTITARFLFKEFVDFTPNYKLFIAGNHKPVIRGADEGIWRRLHLVPFLQTIPEGERDPKLLDKLRAELPGILNWALSGYRQWRRMRLSPPACVKDAVKEYRDEMDLLGHWISEQCTVGSGLSVVASDAYFNYRTWAGLNGYQQMSMASFGRKLGERFSKRKTAKGNVYEGISVGASGGCGGFSPISVSPP